MSREAPDVPVGRVLHGCYVDALKAWCNDHGRGEELETFVARELELTTMTFTISRRMSAYCYIEFSGAKPWQAETYAYRLLMSGRHYACATYQRVA